jgi:transcriptional regulator NrdR family protein
VKHIVKRKGHSEPYDIKKLYASIYSACLAVRTPEGEAELVAERVVGHMNEWLEPKHEVTAHDIRTQAAKHLKAYNPDASYLYEVHRSLHK